MAQRPGHPTTILNAHRTRGQRHAAHHAARKLPGRLHALLMPDDKRRAAA